MHPVSVIEGELSALRYSQDISVKEGISLLIIGRCPFIGLQFKKPRINGIDHFPQGTAFSGSAPSLAYYHNRQLRFLDLHKRSRKLCLLFPYHGLQNIFIGNISLHMILQHRQPPSHTIQP